MDQTDQKKHPKFCLLYKYTGNLKGDGTHLGGLLMFDNTGAEIYRYQEKHFGDVSKTAEVSRDSMIPK